MHGHLRIEAFTNANWVGSLLDRRSTIGYCTFLGDNLVTWKSKKETVVARSIAEAEYRAIGYTSCELMWVKHLLEELRFELQLPMDMYCDNQATVHIASNPVFHERTKYIEVDCHPVHERVENGIIATPFVSTGAQLAHIFTKPLCHPR